MSVDVSVLIVNYNVKDYLLQCLRSLERTDNSITHEVIVVDNQSQDGSVEYLRPMFPNVQFHVMESNVGFGKANNAALEHCSGRYILFLNPDTIVYPESLPTMVRYLDAHPDVGIAGCKVLNPDGSFQLACRRGLPTPWASFCKLFGLQTLFPNSTLFARYNLTYKPINATYEVDALIGAFMMGRAEVVRNAGGFDPAFFMYGEDVDLCYRIQQSGWKVMYVHETRIMHYKGESTRRSSINEVRVFYDAMAIFARKHFGGSTFFLAFLRIGITFRALLARLVRRKREIGEWLIDMTALNLSLLMATAVRFDGPFGFPDYAYPIVQIVVTTVATLSLVAMGEYVEYRPTVRRSLVALLATFFILSSFTYFFKEYAFSRGVLLMTIGSSAVLFTLIRGVLSIAGSRSISKGRRIVLVGLTEQAARIADALRRAENRNAILSGIVATGPFTVSEYASAPVLGDVGYLDRILDSVQAQEVIFADREADQEVLMQCIVTSASYGARLHLASDYDDVITARIINDVAGIEPTVSIPPLLNFRNTVVKRGADILISALALLLVAPILTLLGKTDRVRRIVDVLRGRMSIVGLYPDSVVRSSGKPGITGLAHISNPAQLSPQIIEHLNDFYVEKYSIALDIEIILKTLIRQHRGKHSNSRI